MNLECLKMTQITFSALPFIIYLLLSSTSVLEGKRKGGKKSMIPSQRLNTRANSTKSDKIESLERSNYIGKGQAVDQIKEIENKESLVSSNNPIINQGMKSDSTNKIERTNHEKASDQMENAQLGCDFGKESPDASFNHDVKADNNSNHNDRELNSLKNAHSTLNLDQTSISDKGNNVNLNSHNNHNNHNVHINRNTIEKDFKPWKSFPSYKTSNAEWIKDKEFNDGNLQVGSDYKKNLNYREFSLNPNLKGIDDGFAMDKRKIPTKEKLNSENVNEEFDQEELHNGLSRSKQKIKSGNDPMDKVVDATLLLDKMALNKLKPSHHTLPRLSTESTKITDDIDDQTESQSAIASNSVKSARERENLKNGNGSGKPSLLNLNNKNTPNPNSNSNKNPTPPPQQQQPPTGRESPQFFEKYQDPLPVQDTSSIQFPRLIHLLQDEQNAAIFDQNLFESLTNDKDQTSLQGLGGCNPGDHHQQAPPTIWGGRTAPWPQDGNSNNNPPVTKDISQNSILNANGEPFLFTGQAKWRTDTNCYLIQMDAWSQGENENSELEASLEVLENDLVKSHATKSNPFSNGSKGRSLNSQDQTVRYDPLKSIEALVQACEGSKIKNRWDAPGLRGFSVCFPPGQLPLNLLRSIRGIRYVERDQYAISRKVRPASIARLQEEAPWHLPRLTDPNSGWIDEGYPFSATGKGVTVYTIDSGVHRAHGEFGGRASIGYTVYSGGFPEDCSGHGTQVASIIAGTNVGVAKRARIIVAQILDCKGQGENSALVAALGWIISTHRKPAVINMSVGGPRSPAVDAAVNRAVSRGIPVVVAAGNSAQDSCTYSPSSASSSISVGASSIGNLRARFSNYGNCVTLHAPGVRIVAAAIPGQERGPIIPASGGFTVVSGTSLAAPQVTGILALMLERDPEASPMQLRTRLMEAAAYGVLAESTLQGSPNILAQIPPDIVKLMSGQNISDLDGIEFLPSGTIPMISGGAGSNGASSLEIALLAVAAGLGCVVALLLAGLFLRRQRRKREERLITKIPSLFR